MRMNKRGQAALEFLATYGWAFIVILIVIGALAYFGVTSPSKLLPDRCQFGAEFSCLNHITDVGAGGDLTIRLRNNLGGAVTVTGSTLTLADDQGTYEDGTGAVGTGVCATITGSVAGAAAVDLIPGANSVAIPAGENVDLVFGDCTTGAGTGIDTGRGYIVGEKAKIFVEFDYFESKTGAAFTRTLQGEVFSAVQ